MKASPSGQPSNPVVTLNPKLRDHYSVIMRMTDGDDGICLLSFLILTIEIALQRWLSQGIQVSSKRTNSGSNQIRKVQFSLKSGSWVSGRLLTSQSKREWCCVRTVERNVKSISSAVRTGVL